jgi:hypothetical protein
MPCENQCQVKYGLVTELKWQAVSTTTLIAATEYRWYLPGGTLKTTKEYNKDIRRVYGGIQGQMDVGSDGLPVTTVAVTGKMRLPVAYPTDVTIFPSKFSWVGRIQTEDLDHQVSLCFQQSDWATATITNNIKYTTQPAVTAAATHYRLVPRYRRVKQDRVATQIPDHAALAACNLTAPEEPDAEAAPPVLTEYATVTVSGAPPEATPEPQRAADAPIPIITPAPRTTSDADDGAAESTGSTYIGHPWRGPPPAPTHDARERPPLANDTAAAVTPAGTLAAPSRHANGTVRPLPKRPGRKQSETQMDEVVTAAPVTALPTRASRQGGVMSARVQRSTTLDAAQPAVVEATAVALPLNDGSGDDVAPGSSVGGGRGDVSGGGDSGGHSLLDALAPYMEPETQPGRGGSPRVSYGTGSDGFDDYGPPPEEHPRQPLAINGHLFTPTDDGRALRTEDGHLLQLDGDAVELPSAGRRGGGGSSGGLMGYPGGDYYDQNAGEEDGGAKMKVQLKTGPGGADVLVVDGASMTLGDMRPVATSGARTGGKTGGGNSKPGVGGGSASPSDGKGAAAVPGEEDEPPTGSGSRAGSAPKGQGGAPTASVFKNAAGRLDARSWVAGYCVVGLTVLLVLL